MAAFKNVKIANIFSTINLYLNTIFETIFECGDRKYNDMLPWDKRLMFLNGAYSPLPRFAFAHSFTLMYGVVVLILNK